MNPPVDVRIDSVVKGVLTRYPATSASLISVMQDLQEELRYLPRPILYHVARVLGVSRSRCYQVATFYKAFSLEPRGKHLVSVCQGTACHVNGAGKLADALEAHLGVGDGKTTADGFFTVHNVRCLGCCSLAPVVMIDGKVYGGVTSARLFKTLERYAKSADSRPARRREEKAEARDAT